MMRKYMTTTGHKLIGILYGYSGYIGGLLGFYFSIWIRTELSLPGLIIIRKVNIYNGYYITAFGLLLLLLFWVLYFINNNIIIITLLYEFQNVPLIIMLNSRYYQPINILFLPFFINNSWYYRKLSTISYNLKGIGISSLLLQIYALLSGIILLYSIYINYIYIHELYINNIIIIINNNNIKIEIIISIWLIFVSGGIKLALFPFHIWLGKVHVEAPTIGSILLAAIALKSGYLNII